MSPTGSHDPPPPGAARLALILGAVFAGGATVDLLVARPVALLQPVVWTIGLAVGVGGLVGGAAGLVMQLLRRAPRAAQWIGWIGVGVVVAWWLQDQLGALARLGGPYRALAFAALAGAALAGGGATLLALALQPTRRRPAGWLASLDQRVGVGAVGLLVAASIAAGWVDRTVQPHEYRAAHLVLRWASLLTLTVAVHLTVGRWRMRRHAAWLLVALLVVLVGGPLLRVRKHRYVELDAILSAPLPDLALQSARWFGDFDGDGHSALLGGGDCAPFDAAIHPRAREIPANGVDDNCRRGDAPAPPPHPPPALVSVPSEPSPVSVVLITIDALCARRTNLYGAARPTTPRLAAWARHALVFDRAYAAGGWTSLSLSSLFRGRYPRRLRFTPVVETDQERLLSGPMERQLRPGERPRRVFGLPLADPRKPLWWWLRRRGMRTVAVVDDGRSAFLSRAVGAFSGFDRYVEMDDRPAGQRNDAGVTDAAVDELDAMPWDQEFFLWVHYYGPHKPSSRHAGVPTFGPSAADRYDHEVRYNDGELARLLEVVDLVAADRDLVVIVSSDHGEQFDADHRGHGWSLKEDAIRVPLVMRLPDGAAGRVAGLASLVDLMPTVLAVTETPGPADLDGIDLRSVAAGRAPARVLRADVWHDTGHGEPKRDMTAVFDGRHKLVLDLLTGARRLTTQHDRGRNLLGTTDGGALTDELEQYLEQSYDMASIE